MPIYRIADLNVEINPKFKICRKRLENYAVKSNESGKTDIAISVSDDEIRERLRTRCVGCSDTLKILQRRA